MYIFKKFDHYKILYINMQLETSRLARTEVVYMYIYKKNFFFKKNVPAMGNFGYFISQFLFNLLITRN